MYNFIFLYLVYLSPPELGPAQEDAVLALRLCSKSFPGLEPAASAYTHALDSIRVSGAFSNVIGLFVHRQLAPTICPLFKS